MKENLLILKNAAEKLSCVNLLSKFEHTSTAERNIENEHIDQRGQPRGLLAQKAFLAQRGTA